MPRSLRSLLLTTFLAVFPLSAYAQGGLFPFKRAEDSLAVEHLLDRYLGYDEGDAVPIDSIASISTEELQKWLEKSHGVPTRFPRWMHHHVENAHAIRSDGSSAMVAVAVDVDTIGLFGPVTVDWVFFATNSHGAGWRLNAVRRQNKIEDALAELRNLDTATLFPRSLKPIVARETGRALLSNEQLRQNFAENRERLAQLVSCFNRRDSLWMLGRIDRVASQVNQVGIGWGDAAQEVPQQVRDEFIATLPEANRAEMARAFHALDVMHAKGRDTLRAIAKRLKVPLPLVDSAVALMRDCRVAFVNARLPWKGAVQFTVGGQRDDVVGYLYSPRGEMPLISPDEYFYLEPLGNGWWIFRAT